MQSLRKTKGFNIITFSLFFTMEYSEEVKKLAETLKNSGLAASMKDALERAQSMVGKKEEVKEEPFEKKEDAAQTTLGGVKEKKEEIKESPEPKEELKKEEVFTNKSDKQKSDQNKVDYSKEKKVDLTDVFDVNK
jgi:hypothetical protein